MGAFHAYDIRGIYGQDFTCEDVYKMGFFLPQLLKTKRIAVGRDCRVSSPEVHQYLLRGLCDAGATVFDLGEATTPLVYYATAKHGFDGSVQITASHNPAPYNGLKVSGPDAMPIGYDNGLNLLEDLLRHGTVVPEGGGKVIPFDIRREYLDFQRQYVPCLDGLRVGIDLSNGMAALFVTELLGRQNVCYINEPLDGTFPNHEPNPLIPKNVEQLQALVRQEKCDIGIIYDGDADRVMFTDQEGIFISPDLIIALMGRYFLNGQNQRVLQDIRTSKAVGEYLTPMGAQMHTWRVGRAYAAPKLKEIDGLYGGELAGHYYFRDFFYSDSGILASLIVLQTLINARKKDKEITMGRLIAEIKKYESSGEINFKIDRKQDAMDALRTHFIQEQSPTAQYDFDGYRIEFPDWWFNVRPSNTEPYLRFIAEAKTAALLEEKLAAMRQVLKPFCL